MYLAQSLFFSKWVFIYLKKQYLDNDGMEPECFQSDINSLYGGCTIFPDKVLCLTMIADHSEIYQAKFPPTPNQEYLCYCGTSPAAGQLADTGSLSLREIREHRCLLTPTERVEGMIYKKR